MSVTNLSQDQKTILEALKETKEIKTVCYDELRHSHSDMDSQVIFQELMKLKREKIRAKA